MKPLLLAVLLFLLACAPNQDPLDPGTPTPDAPRAGAPGVPEIGASAPPSGATELNTSASRDMVPRLFPTAVHVVPKKLGDGADAPALVASDTNQKVIGAVWQTPMQSGGTLVVGVYADGTVVGVELLGSTEKALEDSRFLAQFSGKSAEELADADALKPAEGAEESSRAIWEAVRVAATRMKEVL